MEIAATIVALVVFSVVALFTRSQKKDNSFVLSPPSPAEIVSTTNPSPIETPTPAKFLFTPNPTFSPIPTSYSRSNSYTNLIYPNSKIISQNENEIEIENTDDPNKILMWYSQKFSNGFSENSVTNNNINGNTNAEIEVSNNEIIIKVSVNKNNSELYTYVKISVQSQ